MAKKNIEEITVDIRSKNEELIKKVNRLKEEIEKEKSLVTDTSFKLLNIREQEEILIKKHETDEALRKSKVADKYENSLRESKERLSKLYEELESNKENARLIYNQFSEERSSLMKEYIKELEKWSSIKKVYFETMKNLYNLSASYQSEYLMKVSALNKVYGFSDESDAIRYPVDLQGSRWPMLATGAYDLTYEGFYHGIRAAQFKEASKHMAELNKGQTMEEFKLEMEIKEELRREAEVEAALEKERVKKQEYNKNFPERKKVTEDFQKSKEEKKISLKEKIKKELGL